jgi:hypothetical protein
MTADLAEEQTAAQLATERLESEQVHIDLKSIPTFYAFAYQPYRNSFI